MKIFTKILNNKLLLIIKTIDNTKCEFIVIKVKGHSMKTKYLNVNLKMFDQIFKDNINIGNKFNYSEKCEICFNDIKFKAISIIEGKNNEINENELNKISDNLNNFSAALNNNNINDKFNNKINNLNKVRYYSTNSNYDNINLNNNFFNSSPSPEVIDYKDDILLKLTKDINDNNGKYYLTIKNRDMILELSLDDKLKLFGSYEIYSKFIKGDYNIVDDEAIEINYNEFVGKNSFKILLENVEPIYRFEKSLMTKLYNTLIKFNDIKMKIGLIKDNLDNEIVRLLFEEFNNKKVELYEDLYSKKILSLKYGNVFLDIDDLLLKINKDLNNDLLINSITEKENKKSKLKIKEKDSN